MVQDVFIEGSNNTDLDRPDLERIYAMPTMLDLAFICLLLAALTIVVSIIRD